VTDALEHERKPPARGILAPARRVLAHAKALARLERELARTELERKGATVGAGAALAIGAGILAFFAVGFGLATIAAALALVVAWWLALLIVFVLLVALVVALVLVARSLIQSATPLKPEQALEEARLTKQALRSSGDNRAP
jgi:Flp pilus assembly protein TadB